MIEDGTIMGGLCSAVKELMLQNHLCKVESLFYAYPDHFIEHGSISKLEKKYNLDVDSIYKDIIKNFYAK